MKVLLVDDEPDVVEVVSLCFDLRWPGTEILVSNDGQGGVRLAREGRPDVMILDVGLPDIDGFEVLRQVRSTSDVPVIMLTARDEDFNKVKGLELGADDYITKPFSHIELLARVQAVLRRAQMPQPVITEPPFVAGDFSMDFASREVRRGGNLVKLTPTEYNLLFHLVKNTGTVLTHRTLLAKVWGREYVDETDYLKVHIQHLRQKLGDDPQNPTLIATERGVGYRFLRAPEAQPVR